MRFSLFLTRSFVVVNMPPGSIYDSAGNAERAPLSAGVSRSEANGRSRNVLDTNKGEKIAGGEGAVGMSLSNKGRNASFVERAIVNSMAEKHRLHSKNVRKDMKY